MDSLICLWHDYRSAILVLTSSCLLVLQLYAYVAFRRRRASELQPKPIAVDCKPHGLPSSDPTTKETQCTVTSRLNTRAPPKRIVGTKSKKHDVQDQDLSFKFIQPTVFYCSLSGTTAKAANDFIESLRLSLNSNDSPKLLSMLKPDLLDLSYIEYDDYFTSLPSKDPEVKHFYIILTPSYDIDTALSNFLEHLRETHHDFRVDSTPLAELLGYAVFGLGDQEGWPTEDKGFCSQAKEIDKWMARLTGGKRAYPLGMGDVKTDGLERLQEWRNGVEGILEEFASGKSLGDGIPGSGDALESDDEEDKEEERIDPIETFANPQNVVSGTKKYISKKARVVDDLEDLGGKTRSADTTATPIDFTTYSLNPPSTSQPPKEMVSQTSPTHAALTKQGYTIVGSHSGVKICRWTKSALRGRGSCYKFSFYGIKSHLCMEATPSLSCSNKCVFCWRHGTNPVGTTWRWKVDPPDLIFDGVKKGHYAKIKMMRGVPGVRAERFEEAMKIRHCALSLVGEPIFYPHINEFTAMLHKERISSFLVCNAQHPDQLASLQPVTQLYVSIDASNRESLRKIDRPLHRDFWERFCRCLDILREKRFRQRTVFRLTLVKGFNIENEAEGYADLVAKGLPCFVEVKGVTYCGTSTSAGAGLTMKNVPFYEEVCSFVQALNEALERRGLEYGIAAEHAHSCCVLLASKRFLVGGKWHSVIDYHKFFELLDSGREFAPEEYTAETPEWALWGNGGFDPADQRVLRKKAKQLAHAE